MALELSDESKKIIKNINTLLEQHTDVNPDNYMFAKDFNSVLKDIERIKQEFESEVFFIANIGSIKSGKSTLINLLAHKVVSTTKQGKETTMRPAIISLGKKDQIILFNPIVTMTDEDKSKAFDESIDYIKGLVTEEELTKVTINTQPADEPNLSKYLTEKNIINEDPILVNIQVVIDEDKFPSSLLAQKVAIIDTPGIDGVLASAEGLNDSEVKIELMNRVDLMLFLQSSVTPINNDSEKFIKKLKKDHSISSMRLVHNEFSLKGWRKDKDIPISDTDQESIENAKKLFN